MKNNFFKNNTTTKNGTFFMSFLCRCEEQKRLIMNNYSFSQKNPDLKEFSKIKLRWEKENPGLGALLGVTQKSKNDIIKG